MPLAVGTLVREIEGVVPDGTRQVFRLEGRPRPTVLYAFSPNCVWCQRTWPLFKSIWEARKNDYSFVAVSLDQTQGAFEADFLMLANPSRNTVAALRVKTVPQTIVVETNGRVEKVWLGAYSGTTGTEIEQFFGVRLAQLAPVDR